MRTILHYFLILAITITTSSCATHALHSSKNVSTEKIKSFLITQNKSTLVVAGERYHFIFPLNDPLTSILEWSGRTKLNPTFSEFTVDSSQKVNGAYILEANIDQLNTSEQQFLVAHGFSRQGTTLTHKASIQGTRYLAGNVNVPQTAFFRQPYAITLVLPDGVADTAAKAALTPLTLAADGVTLALAGIILGPLYGLLMIGGH
ncbi:hypothetical protein HMY34_08905 [Thiothrix subterranea]|uniref:hypothetical protein n=1 Tax=Thiothrix subterranea TaxID=2735563 RepID=UPI00192C3156|nr:hypothetical protein [Thiothrix subterranea]QQZ28862.1 hypothetical protein HMY34_08905 [Thiothrix subterranea]